MAKRNEGLNRIGQIAPAKSVAVPTYRCEDKVNAELIVNGWKFEVVENGGEKVTIDCQDALTGDPLELTTFDKAIVAQLMSVPADTPMPIAAKVVKFGRYYALD
jgi:hypothetical protein